MSATYESVLGIAETLSKADRRRLARKLLDEAEDAGPKERVGVRSRRGS